MIDIFETILYRCGDWWYRLKCFLWKRHTTLKPRYLGHTWCDRSHILHHMMFEILSEFIEQECGEDCVVDWEASDHRVIVHGFSVNVRDEMQDLYDWWHTVYVPYEERVQYREMWDTWLSPFKPVVYTRREKRDGVEFWAYDPVWRTPGDRHRYKGGMDFLRMFEEYIELELEDRLHRLVKVRPYMWT